MLYWQRISELLLTRFSDESMDPIFHVWLLICLVKDAPHSGLQLSQSLWCKTGGNKHVSLPLIESFPHTVCTSCSNRPVKLLNPRADWCLRGWTFSLRPLLKQIILFECARPPCCHVALSQCTVCVWGSWKRKNTHRLWSSWSGFLSADVNVFLPFIWEETADCEFHKQIISVAEQKNYGFWGTDV